LRPINARFRIGRGARVEAAAPRAPGSPLRPRSRIAGS
jgi:hypothetical protein